MGLLITDHNVRETLEITDRAYIMHEGRILVDGDSEEIADDPVARKFYLGERFPAVTLLGRYILRELAGPLFFGILAFTGLFFSVDLVQMVRMAAEYGAPWRCRCQLIALRLPQIVVYTFPMAVLLAALLTLSRLSANSEIVAMQAGTVSFYRIVAPVIAVGPAGQPASAWRWKSGSCPRPTTSTAASSPRTSRAVNCPPVTRNVILKEYQGGLLRGFLIRLPLRRRRPASCTT